MSLSSGPVGVKMGTTCAVHVHSEFVPSNVHHIWPLGLGGPDVSANKITVCMNGHGQIHAYMDMLIKYGDDVPWQIRQHFGGKVIDYATRGWTAAGKPRTGRS